MLLLRHPLLDLLDRLLVSSDALHDLSPSYSNEYCVFSTEFFPIFHRFFLYVLIPTICLCAGLTFIIHSYELTKNASIHSRTYPFHRRFAGRAIVIRVLAKLTISWINLVLSVDHTLFAIGTHTLFVSSFFASNAGPVNRLSLSFLPFYYLLFNFSRSTPVSS